MDRRRGCSSSSRVHHGRCLTPGESSTLCCTAAIRATTGETNDFRRPRREQRPRLGVSVTGAGATSGAVSGASGGAASASGSAAGAPRRPEPRGRGAFGSRSLGGSGLGPFGPDHGQHGADLDRLAFSCTRISLSTPVAGLGTSGLTLSVEISGKRFPFHGDRLARLLRPLGDSPLGNGETPIWGITTSTAGSSSHLVPRTRPGPEACDDVLDLREERLLERGRRTAPACRVRRSA